LLTSPDYEPNATEAPVDAEIWFVLFIAAYVQLQNVSEHWVWRTTAIFLATGGLDQLALAHDHAGTPFRRAYRLLLSTVATMPHIPVDFPPTRDLRNRSIRSLRAMAAQGDWVGRGKTWRFEPGASAVFSGTMWNQNNQLTLSIATPGTTAGGWSLTIAAPAGTALSRGMYRNAKRIPPIGSSDPQLILSGEGRCCNASTGEFEVLDATYGPPPNSGASGTIDYFHATFKQTCDGSSAGLTGEVRLVSIPLGCRVSGNG
jgi:hypothetical protein